MSIATITILFICTLKLLPEIGQEGGQRWVEVARKAVFGLCCICQIGTVKHAALHLVGAVFEALIVTICHRNVLTQNRVIAKKDGAAHCEQAV